MYLFFTGVFHSLEEDFFKKESKCHLTLQAIVKLNTCKFLVKTAIHTKFFPLTVLKVSAY